MALLLTTAALRADYTYQSTIKHGRESSVTTSFIKGNRIAIVAKARTTVIDLDKETITEIDAARKQYSVIPFAQVKPAGPEPDSKASVQSTGKTKAIGVLNAKEVVITISGAQEITVDAWLAAVPGYDEVKDFQRKMAAKLGYAYAAQNAAVATQMNKVEGAPVEFTTKIGPAETTTHQDSFSGPVDAAKFVVPAGFKKVDATAASAQK